MVVRLYRSLILVLNATLKSHLVIMMTLTLKTKPHNKYSLTTNQHQYLPHHWHSQKSQMMSPTKNSLAVKLVSALTSEKSIMRIRNKMMSGFQQLNNKKCLSRLIYLLNKLSINWAINPKNSKFANQKTSTLLKLVVIYSLCPSHRLLLARRLILCNHI